MSSQISGLKVKKVSQLLDLPSNISDKDALIMIATLTDNYKISINYLLSGVKNTINSNAKIALSNLIDLSKNISITSNNSILSVTDNSTINSNGLRYPQYNISLSESKISQYGDITNGDGVVTGNELQHFVDKVNLDNTKLENKIFDINDKLNNLETSSNIENLNKKIQELESNIYNIENNANITNNNLSNLDNDVQNIKSNISSINSDISNLENKINNLDISSYTVSISSDNENVLINYENNSNNKEVSYLISLKTSLNNDDGLITKNEVISLIDNLDIDTKLNWEIK